LEVSFASLAAGTEGRMVQAGFAGRIARNALPVGLRAVSDSTGGAYIVADTLVHIKVVRAVEADEVLSALLTASGATSAD